MFIDINNADNFYINGNQGEKVYLQGRQIYPRNYYNEYFTIEPLSSGYLSSEQDLYYTTDDITWNFLSSNNTLYINDNKKYKIKGSGCRKLYYTGNYNVYGNILSLFYGDDFLPVRGVTLDGLFKNQTGLINAENLILPNILPSIDGAYSGMFYGCTSLVSAPALPATTLYSRCYHEMFYHCTSLVSAPDLPATNLSYSCYADMFIGCTSLVNVPTVLPATTLYDWCYQGMFNGCTSLVNAPALPATTLYYLGYAGMFAGCTSLVNAPALPATTLADKCYSGMFDGCTSLVNAPALPATTLYDYCYDGMFYGCTSLVNAPDLPATILEEYSYRRMFYRCTSLNHVKCLAQVFKTSSTTDWLNGVSSTGTFVKDANTTWPIGDSGIPTGWTVINN